MESEQPSDFLSDSVFDVQEDDGREDDFAENRHKTNDYRLEIRQDILFSDSRHSYRKLQELLQRMEQCGIGKDFLME
jgi:hypothetical protein